MDIHQNNYEEYVLEYLEGTLPEHLEKKMDLFFQNNPQVWEEVHDLNTFTLPKPQISYQAKKSLKKNESKLFSMWSVGVAAAVIGILLWGGIQFFQMQQPEPAATTSSLTNKETVINKTENQNNNSIAQEQTKSASVSEQPMLKEKQTGQPSLSKQANQPQAKQLAPVHKTTAQQKVNNPQESKKIRTVEPLKQVQVEQNFSFGEITLPVKPALAMKTVEPVPFAVPEMNDHETAENEQKEDGFEVETFPAATDTATEQASLPTHKKDQKNGFLSFIDIDTPDKQLIKQSLLPKSFGFENKKQ